MDVNIVVKVLMVLFVQLLWPRWVRVKTLSHKRLTRRRWTDWSWRSQQCKDFIQTQQQLLQVRLNSHSSHWDSSHLPFATTSDLLFLFLQQQLSSPCEEETTFLAERLLRVSGERASQRGVDDLRGTEEDLWEGEEELYRSSHKTEPRGDLCNRSKNHSMYKTSVCCVRLLLCGLTSVVLTRVWFAEEGLRGGPRHVAQTTVFKLESICRHKDPPDVKV